MLHSCFFIALRLRPPRSSLFPYTTLFRSRLRIQRDIAYEMLNEIPGISCIKPEGALYCFPKMDIKKFNIHNDERMVLDLLEQQKILVVHGSAFNWPEPNHFRVVFLPRAEDLTLALSKTRTFFEKYKQL